MTKFLTYLIGIPICIYIVLKMIILALIDGFRNPEKSTEEIIHNLTTKEREKIKMFIKKKGED